MFDCDIVDHDGLHTSFGSIVICREQFGTKATIHLKSGSKWLVALPRIKLYFHESIYSRIKRNLEVHMRNY